MRLFLLPSWPNEVVKYSFAYINPRTCGVDKGRVLGYDNSHDYDHRHFMGEVEEVEFPGYEALVDRFQKRSRGSLEGRR